MAKKYIKYWFSALPFTVALKVLAAYLFTKVFRNSMGFYFSQTGEDIILSTLINKEGGTYVDVGCNDPIGKSNTFLLYLKGWKGITIDANEELIRKHRKIRKKDKAIFAAVSNTVKEVTFYKSDENAVSTISEDFYNENKSRWAYSKTQTLQTRTVTSILNENLEEGATIDLLTVDVEGIDLEVLEGIDFKIYRPKLIVIEIHGFLFENKEQNSIYRLLLANNYKLHGFVTMNAYFIDAENE
jgi:FkbM family methyltransferase